jgi:hypothetical protein
MLRLLGGGQSPKRTLRGGTALQWRCNEPRRASGRQRLTAAQTPVAQEKPTIRRSHRLSSNPRGGTRKSPAIAGFLRFWGARAQLALQ